MCLAQIWTFGVLVVAGEVARPIPAGQFGWS
jgi:hypothetical protein